MTRNITCIECPVSCSLSVDIENCKVVKVSGNKCPKGETYAASEIENPLRILTATVAASGLSLKMIPVRTDKPIPKSKILLAASEIRKMTVSTPVRPGSVIRENFLSLGVNLVATRSASENRDRHLFSKRRAP